MRSCAGSSSASVSNSRRGHTGTLLLLSVVVVALVAAAPADQTVQETLARADQLLLAGKPDEALQLLQPAAGASPGPAVEARIGKAYYQKRSLDLAIPHLQRAVEGDPTLAESRQLLALSYYSGGAYDKAIPLLEPLKSSTASTAFDALYILGICYLKTDKLDQSRGAFAAMYSVAPDSAAGHFVFAQMLVRQHAEDQAIPELKRAIELDPRLPMARFLLGELLLARSETSAALDQFQREIELSPSVWLVYWRLGDALGRLGRYDEAERALKQSIWLNDSFSSPYVLLGQIALRRGDVQLALGFMERAAKMDPNNYKAHYSLAKAYSKAGREDLAQQEFNLARSLLVQKSNTPLH
jgi:tetratricopeptide (TPR) repeat protein